MSDSSDILYRKWNLKARDPKSKSVWTDKLCDFTYEDYFNPNGNPTIGSTCSACITFTVYENPPALMGEVVEIVYSYDEEDEKALGIFKIIKQEASRDKLKTTYTGYDAMIYAFEKTYVCQLEGDTYEIPQNVIAEISELTGIEIDCSGLNDVYPIFPDGKGTVSEVPISQYACISTKPTNLTYRQVIGYIAALAGKNAKINNEGILEFVWYSKYNKTQVKGEYDWEGLGFSTGYTPFNVVTSDYFSEIASQTAADTMKYEGVNVESRTALVFPYTDETYGDIYQIIIFDEIDSTSLGKGNFALVTVRNHDKGHVDTWDTYMTSEQYLFEQYTLFKNGDIGYTDFLSNLERIDDTVKVKQYQCYAKGDLLIDSAIERKIFPYAKYVENPYTLYFTYGTTLESDGVISLNLSNAHIVNSEKTLSIYKLFFSGDIDESSPYCNGMASNAAVLEKISSIGMDRVYEDTSDSDIASNWSVGKIIGTATYTDSEGDEKQNKYTAYDSDKGDGTLTFDNPYLTEPIMNGLKSQILGFMARTFTVKIVGDFNLRAGNIVDITWNGEQYTIPIMHITHEWDGGLITNIYSTADSDSETSINATNPVTRTLNSLQTQVINNDTASYLYPPSKIYKTTYDGNIKHKNSDTSDQLKVIKFADSDGSTDERYTFVSNIETGDFAIGSNIASYENKTRDDSVYGGNAIDGKGFAIYTQDYIQSYTSAGDEGVMPLYAKALVIDSVGCAYPTTDENSKTKPINEIWIHGFSQETVWTENRICIGMAYNYNYLTSYNKDMYLDARAQYDYLGHPIETKLDSIRMYDNVYGEDVWGFETHCYEPMTFGEDYYGNADPSTGNVSDRYTLIQLPPASKTSYGGVKIGENITVTDSEKSETYPSYGVGGGIISVTKTNIIGALGYTPVDSSLIGEKNGVAELDENGRVPTSQLPSYVGDVAEYDTVNDFPTTGESGKIYVDKSTNLTYRWGGTTYVEISPSIALGETASTAYRGDRGAIAYNHSQTKGNPHETTAADIGLGNVPNVATNDQTPTFTGATTRENLKSGESVSTLFGKIYKWFSDLKNVAFSGSYNDLSDKPEIPSVGNGTITITQAGETKGTFSTNQAGNVTIELTDENTTYSTATTSSNGLMSASDKTKLDGIATGAQVNQNAFSNVVVGSTTVAADRTTDSLTLEAGNNITLTPDATNNKITIAATTDTNTTYSLSKSGSTITLTGSDGTTTSVADSNTTYSAATTSQAGLMSEKDKSKLDGIDYEANNYTLPTATSSVLGGVKTGDNITNSSGVISLTKDNVVAALGYTPGTGSGSVTGVKGSAETTYRTGNVNITPANLGITVVNNTADSNKSVKYATSAGSASSATTASSCSGNAATATKLATARTINGVSFDGTANITVADSTKLPLAGGILTGAVTGTTYTAATAMTLSAGKVSGLVAGTTTMYGNGIAISNPATANDVGFIRCTGTGESDTVLEIATGDDGDSGESVGESIVVRQYNTSNAVAREAYLLNTSGNTSFPGTVTAPTFSGSLNGNATTATTAGTCSGNAATATALTTSAGNATQPIYFSNGKPVACTYTLAKSVPSNAVFTDTNTTYSAGTGLSLSGTTFSFAYSIATSGTTDSWGKIPIIGGADGVMEVGKYIDFHASDGSTVDYDVRLTATSGVLSCSGGFNASAFNSTTAGTSGGYSVSGYRVLWKDNEGINFMITGADGDNYFQFDSHNSTNLRIYHGNSTATNDVNWSFSSTDGSFTTTKLKATSSVSVDGYVVLSKDGEGGNIEIKSANNTYGYQWDAYSDSFMRLYCFKVSPWTYMANQIFTADGWTQSSASGGGGGFAGPYITAGTTSGNSEYNLYVNGTSYMGGNREWKSGTTTYFGTTTGNNKHIGITTTAYTTTLTMYPNYDSTIYLGGTSYRLYQVYSLYMYTGSGTAVTSDRRYKNTISDLDSNLMQSFVMKLKPSSFKYNDGESGRLHYGLIAQDVEETMNELNIDSQDFGGLVIEEMDEMVDKETGEVDEDGNPITETVIEKTGETQYALRYEEFIAPLISVCQQQQALIDELQERVAKLEATGV